ncbi:MAG: hypothetical protein ISR65_05320 [Bacteriovoracaceae bacterium]|nr:hypothetical protein [Bacteriovoracaceae bacterium]
MNNIKNYFLARSIRGHNPKRQLSSAIFVLFILILQPTITHSATAKKKKRIFAATDSFYDPNIDYSRFIGRVTDRDITSHVLKVNSTNTNVKFFRTGDPFTFKVGSMLDRDSCEGYVRSSERGYFVIFVKDFSPCFGITRRDYFRRGAMLYFHSETLARRTKESSIHRAVLLQRREDFFRQLNQTNHFLITYDQQKVRIALDYDKKILELERAKKRAVDSFLAKKNEQIALQKELKFRLDAIDRDLENYRVDKVETIADRWHVDNDLGIPVKNRPPRKN